MANAPHRNLQLDVLRGVAILLVLGRHLELDKPSGVIGTFSEIWFRLGWLGVDLFFVLSGFLIGGLLLAEVRRAGRIDVPRFLIRRAFKIYPGYFVFIAYLIAMPVLKTFVGGGNPWSTLASQWVQYWPNLVFLQNYVGPNPAGHTWSLAVEEHFYLLLPLVLFLLAKAGRMEDVIPLCVGVGAACLVLRGISVLTNDQFSTRMAATHLRIDALMCGVGVRAVAEYHSDMFNRLRAHRLALVILGLGCWSIHLVIEPQTAFVRMVGMSMNYIGGAAFLVAAYHTRRNDFGSGREVMRAIARALGWMGVYSYGIYLWHTTAMGILGRELGGRLIAAIGWNPLTWMATAAVMCGGAVVTGMAATKIVELPVLRLRDRLFPNRTRSLPVVLDGPQARPQPSSGAVTPRKPLASRPGR